MSLEDLRLGIRFLSGLPNLVRHPVTLEEASATLRRRLENRDRDFLYLAEKAIYGPRPNPYRTLLKDAGCEFGDLKRLVRKEGLNQTLLHLFRCGVFLTEQEYKGECPVVRGSTKVWVDPAQIFNPMCRPQVAGHSGGSGSSGGEATIIPFSLAFIRDRSVNVLLSLHARGAQEWLHARWGVPGGSAMREILSFAACGNNFAKWFSPIDLRSHELHPRYRWSVVAMNWVSGLLGKPLPTPQPVPLQDPAPILRWIADTAQKGATPHLFTYVSSALKLCQAAQAEGMDLQKVRFSVGGEPATATRLAAIRKLGAHVAPHYGATECGCIAQGCLASKDDDMHFFHDQLALVQPGADGDANGLPPETNLYSSLRNTAPLILLNTTLGDRSTVTQYECGCPLESLGWTTHLRQVRSFAKSTAGGLSVSDSLLARFLEETLPDRFGGGPIDYQLVEMEKEDGSPRLTLVVSPSVGEYDPRAFVQEFFEFLRRNPRIPEIASLLWRDGEVFAVERRPPFTTTSGKVLHWHRVGN